MADEDRTPLDRALDTALHLPVGLFLDAKDRLPELTEKGRQHVDSQIKVARTIGEFVVTIGTKELVKRFGHLFGDAPGPDGAARPDEATDAPPDTDASSADADASAREASSSAAAPRASRKPRAATPAPARPARPARLPIDGYDTLAASQVIARLDALAPAELESVRAYEASHRNRKTILGRVAQLQRG